MHSNWNFVYFCCCWLVLMLIHINQKGAFPCCVCVCVCVENCRLRKVCLKKNQRKKKRRKVSVTTGEWEWYHGRHGNLCVFRSLPFYNFYIFLINISFIIYFQFLLACVYCVFVCNCVSVDILLCYKFYLFFFFNRKYKERNRIGNLKTRNLP